MSTWNPADLAVGQMTLTGGNLTANSGPVIGVAVDLGANKLWLWNPLQSRWNGAASGTQNPATGTGGYDISYITGAKFPGWTGYTSPNADVAIANFGATSFEFAAPSGFSSWNALAGTTTWNPSDTSPNIALSNGNLTATAITTTSAFRSVRATTSLSAGKAYFEVSAAAIDGSSGWFVGLANATAPLTSYFGSDLNGIGYQAQGTVYENGGHLADIDAYNTGGWRSVRGTGSESVGKRYLEVTASLVDGSNGFIFGLANASFGLTGHFAGYDNNGIGFQQQGTVWLNNTSPISGSGYAVGATAGLAVDLGAHTLWFYSPASGLWNNGAIGSQNPATGVGGISISVLGSPLYPVFSALSWPDIAVLNVGGSAFVNAVPSGFEAWDAVTQALLTQIAVEQWAQGTPAAQLTQIAVEQWASLAIAPPTGPAYMITASRAGVPSAAVWSTTTRSYMVPLSAALAEAPAPAPIGPTGGAAQARVMVLA